ncbi:thioesterase family protein [Roseovarius sp. SCSIO 43702]|uniref:thioesterase family protein n=1 Tax=Roseovarius sp. SCSIO 43702 TaxID=2823043 RepID=UPI001C72A69F|nr:thioesterase family protein [Roseovarius sp. SCSIO 43702]QYX58166.1 thioesterase family protein [Roseovarius sp. SCSIO 43702]
MTQPAPILSSWLEIEPGWIDHNNHLNMGYYTVLFDRAADEVFERFGFGPDYVKTRNHTTFSGEFHLRYLREVKLGDRLRASFWLIDHDAKRFHTFQQLYHEDGWISATGEGLTLHVDLDGPRVTPMPPEIEARVAAMAREHAAWPRPDGVGRRVGIPRKSA